MMMRLMIALLGAGLMCSAMAAEDDQAGQGAAPVVTAPAAASAVSVTAHSEAAVPPSNTPESHTQQADAPAPKSSIPLDQRKGGDITQCLEQGSNQEIAACAEKYRP